MLLLGADDKKLNCGPEMSKKSGSIACSMAIKSTNLQQQQQQQKINPTDPQSTCATPNGATKSNQLQDDTKQSPQPPPILLSGNANSNQSDTNANSNTNDKQPTPTTPNNRPISMPKSHLDQDEDEEPAGESLPLDSSVVGQLDTSASGGVASFVPLDTAARAGCGPSPPSSICKRSGEKRAKLMTSPVPTNSIINDYSSSSSSFRDQQQQQEQQQQQQQQSQQKRDNGKKKEVATNKMTSDAMPVNANQNHQRQQLINISKTQQQASASKTHHRKQAGARTMLPTISNNNSNQNSTATTSNTPNQKQQQQQQQQQQQHHATTTNEPTTLIKSNQTQQPDKSNIDTTSPQAAQLLLANNSNKQQQNICAACLRPIRERYLLMALDKKWHEDCLKCACCDCRLGEVGSSLFTHSDKILCRRDFLRIFGQHGLCAACKRPIPPYEMVMRANENAYHMDCFACQQCRYRFCVGDRFHLTGAHRVVCVICHGEQQQQQQQQQSHVGEPQAARQLQHRPVRTNYITDQQQQQQVDMDLSAQTTAADQHRAPMGHSEPITNNGQDLTQLNSSPGANQQPRFEQLQPNAARPTISHHRDQLPFASDTGGGADSPQPQPPPQLAAAGKQQHQQQACAM